MANSDLTAKVGGEPLTALPVDSRAFWLDVLDRASRTFLQTVLLFLTAGATIVDISWTGALASAAMSAFVSVLMAVSTATAVSSGNFLIDLADRAGRTFAATLVGAITATGTDIYHFSIAAVAWREVLLLAVTASLVSVVTSLSTVNLGGAKGVPSLAPVLSSSRASVLAAIEILDEHAVPTVKITGVVDDQALRTGIPADPGRSAEVGRDRFGDPLSDTETRG